MTIKRNALTVFAKQNCCNFNRQNNECLPTDSVCKILEGKPCGWFRDAVLRGCDLAYPYAKNVEKFPTLKKLYKQIDPAYGNVIEEQKARFCECGQPLKPRQRYCEKCARKRRLATYRKKRQISNMSAPQLTETALYN